MRTKTTRLAAIGAVVLSAVALSACSSGGSGSNNADCTPKHSDITTVTDGVLSVGVTDTPPFSSNVDGGGEGLDIDIVNKIAEIECLDVEFTQATYASSIPLITQQQQIDLTTGDWYPTAERNKVVDFAAPMYTDSMGIVSKTDVTSVAGLEGLSKVGTVDGYLWTEDLKAVLGDKLQTYPSSVELQQDVLNGRLDAGVDSFGVLTNEFKDESDYKVEISEPDERVVASVEPAQAVFPMTKGNTSLQTALNEDIEGFREDGTMAQLLEDNGLDASIAVPAGEELRIIGS